MAPRVALITGCSSGIGLSTAVMLAQDSAKGYIVYATMRNLAKKGDLEKAAGSALNDTLFIIDLDVTKHDTITKAVKTILDKHGRLDILINNAAIGGIGYLECLTFEQIRQVFETNFFGAVRLTQEIIPIMKKQRSGHIIGISSVAGTFGLPFFEIYVATKYALEGFSESIAASLRPFNIWKNVDVFGSNMFYLSKTHMTLQSLYKTRRVSTVQPGPVHTKFADNMAGNNQPGFEQVKNENVDELSRQTLDKGLQIILSSPELSEMQTGEDIAKVVQGALTADKPHFQYPTSVSRAEHAAKKFVDPTNDTSVNYFADACTPDSK